MTAPTLTSSLHDYYIGTSVHQDSQEVTTYLRTLSLTDAQEARYWELYLAGKTSMANRIRDCGRYKGRACGERYCPSCSTRLAQKRAAKAHERISKMENPKLVLFTLPTSLYGLSENLRFFRATLRKFNRQKGAKGLKTGVGALEAPVSRNGDGQCFNLHAHVVVDVADEAALECAPRIWSDLTEGKGKFSVHASGELASSYATAVYITKPDTLCPEPGGVRIDKFERLMEGLWSQRLGIEWGTTSSRRKGEPCK